MNILTLFITRAMRYCFYFSINIYVSLIIGRFHPIVVSGFPCRTKIRMVSLETLGLNSHLLS